MKQMLQDQLNEIKKDLVQIYRKLAYASNTANVSNNESLALDIAIEMEKIKLLNLKLNQFWNRIEECDK